MKRKIVLHLISHLGLGGSQTIAKGIVEHSTHDIFLVSLRNCPEDIEVKLSQDRTYKYSYRYKYSLLPIFRLRKLIHEHNIEILHCHMFQAEVVGWLTKIIFYRKLILVFHEHGEVVYGSFLYRFFLKVSKSRIDKYIAVSNYIARELCTVLGEKSSHKVVTISNFFDSIYSEKLTPQNNNDTNSLTRKTLQINETDFVVGFAGRIEEVKGWMDLVSVAKYFLDKPRMKIKFIIAGVGSQSVDLEKMIKVNNLSHMVIQLGRLVTNMTDFYKLLNCLIVPSRVEPFGLVAIEAQAMGIPVIASDIPGLGEIIHHLKNGLTFPVGDTATLRERILSLYSDKLLIQNVINSSRSSVQEYTVEKYIQKIDLMYEKFQV